jgi:hypothetical protein
MRFDEPKFNDDLLLEEADRERAAQHYPTILHVLDDPELKECFRRFDAPANQAKGKSRILGSVAIILGAIAVMGASAEIVFTNSTSIAERISILIWPGSLRAWTEF